ncbi:MAG: phosphatidylglycerophosphatase A [Campylobacterota bacterium]|nr:phosphatidylglycerophosphatase A [Campylobacterota bacterium]
MTLQKLFLTFLGSGLAPKAPGTFGTLAALPVGVLVLHYLGVDSLVMLTFAVTFIAIFEINKYEKLTGEHDQKEIVIDEAVGIWLALIIAYSTLQSVDFAYAQLLAIILSFATFRLFDIWKPSTIGWIDREVKGGMGVMGDDILAGIAGGILTSMILVGLAKVL